MDGQSIVYTYKVNDLLLFTLLVYRGWVSGKKIQESVYVVIECPHPVCYKSDLVNMGALGAIASMLFKVVDTCTHTFCVDFALILPKFCILYTF